MRIGQETISGKQYYTVKCDTKKPWPWREVAAWCEQTYGPIVNGGGSRWYRNDIVTNGKLWIRDEQDLMWLRLKWS